MEAVGDYYAVLRVSADADEAALRRAYRDLMRRYHPDVTHDADAEERCRAINEAYACLRDPASRASYDVRRRARHAGRRGTVTTPPTPFTPNFAARLDEELGVQSNWGKAAAIAFGIIATIVTFAVTAAVDRPAPAETHEIVMKPRR